MAHKPKDKNEKNLIYLEKNDKDSSSLVLAQKVLKMYVDDFNLTVGEICDLLQCERQWVMKYVKDNVKHLFLNNKYKTFLMEVDREHPVEEGVRVYLKDYYYFSRNDFYKWLKKNTVATKQTQRIDINIYSKDISDFKKITDEYREELKKDRNSISVGMANIQYENEIAKTLNEVGKKIFAERLGVTNRRKVIEVELKQFDIPEKLRSIKSMKEDYGTNSIEIIYRDLYKYGAIKYTICKSLVRYDESFVVEDYEKSPYPYSITIPYEYYKKKVSKLKNKGSDEYEIWN